MQRVILVTGGAGFIGSHLVDRLLALGYKVVVVDNLSTGRKENINPDATWYKIDVSDKKALSKIFIRHAFDYCIHEAAKINLNVMLEDPRRDVESSVQGTINLLECCRHHAVRKFIYASSVAVYGRPKTLPASETDALLPIYSYGIAKKCAEEYIRYYSSIYGLNFTILRYGNVYGPRQPIFGEVGVIAIFTDNIIKGKPLIIYGTGKQLRDYIYIDDAVEATLKVLNTADRETFNVGCGIGVSVNEIAKHFSQILGKKTPCIHKPERIGEIGRFYADTKKISQTIGFRPAVSIKQGVAKTLLYYYKNSNLLSLDHAISLRPLNRLDRRMIFQWRNTPFLIRLGSSGKAVTWKEHCSWFNRTLKKDAVQLYIVLFNNLPVGQVRFDMMKKGTYKISIYLLEDYTGKGIGSIALKKAMELMGKKNREFIAFIKRGNKASNSVFLKTGFRVIKDYPHSLPGHTIMRYRT